MRVFMNAERRALAREFSSPRAGDAGYDLHAIEESAVAPLQRVALRTGLHIEIPAGCVGLVKDRSSVASAGMHCLAGVIDSSYRGELKVLMVNLDSETALIKAGQKIAQLIVVPVLTEEIELAARLEELSPSERGEGGFGSTGE
ncbi:MAG: dUTP diphosphatase [Chloroflexi bacterium]|nr:dUTP diphosphatase [Chloroflexota bacterium]